MATDARMTDSDLSRLRALAETFGHSPEATVDEQAAARALVSAVDELVMRRRRGE